MASLVMVGKGNARCGGIVFSYLCASEIQRSNGHPTNTYTRHSPHAHCCIELFHHEFISEADAGHTTYGIGVFSLSGVIDHLFVPAAQGRRQLAGRAPADAGTQGRLRHHGPVFIFHHHQKNTFCRSSYAGLHFAGIFGAVGRVVPEGKAEAGAMVFHCFIAAGRVDSQRLRSAHPAVVFLS
jgi:hypothetical protein